MNVNKLGIVSISIQTLHFLLTLHLIEIISREVAVLVIVVSIAANNGEAIGLLNGTMRIAILLQSAHQFPLVQFNAIAEDFVLTV